MRFLSSLVLAIALALPAGSRGEPAADEAEAAIDPRESSRFLLMFGTGFPDLLHAEVDVALIRYLAVTGRVGGIPDLLLTASVGALGILRLSSDSAVVPRHALGVEVAYGVLMSRVDGDVEDGGRSGPQFPTRTTPFFSGGYLFTSSDGLHLRLMAGALRADDRWFGDIRFAVGGLL